MHLTDILECQKLKICVQLSVPNKRNLLHRPMIFFSEKNVTSLQVYFAIIQSTFYRLIKGQHYLKKMYEIN